MPYSDRVVPEPGDPFVDRFDVQVDGGRLAVWRAGAEVSSGAPVVLAAHGITANHMSWAPTARALAADDVCLLAPDLRGRGDSARIDGPWGARAHAEDLAAVLVQVGADSCIAVGHSLGGYLVSYFAARRPDLVTSVVVVDGGVPIAVPDGVDPEQAIRATLGPAIARLSQVFASRESYHDFWRAHPAFDHTGISDADLVNYADADLGLQRDGLRPRARPDAVRADFSELLVDQDVRTALAGLEQPIVLLRAPRGLMNENTPFVTGESAQSLVAARPDRRRLIEVADANHYSITLGTRGATAIAAAIRAMVATSTS